jgi:Methyltransferase domain
LRRVRERIATFRARRFNCHLQESPAWEERSEHAVRLWREHGGARNGRASVADLGAGNERLRRVLERELDGAVEYHGYDLHPQQVSTARLDVRTSLPSRRFDAVFCLGVIEYLEDPEDFLRRLAGIGHEVVTSYVVSDSPDRLTPAERRARGWLSDHTRASFEALGADAGLQPVAFESIDRDRTGLWLWRADG